MSLKSRLEAIFGRISWEPPHWLGRQSAPGQEAIGGTKLGKLVRGNASSILAIVTLLVAGAFIYRYQGSRPPPPDKLQLRAVTQAPNPPPRRLRSDPVPAPQAIYVQFDGSAAPLDQINKPVKEHVSIAPAVPGEWTWLNERTLAFTPKNAWAIGQTYSVKLEPQLVQRQNVVLMTDELTFQTQPFTGRVQAFEFYQDPVDPLVKQVVATFDFNYPIDSASFEKLISLSSNPQSDATQVAKHKISISYDDLKFQAYVRSEALPLPLEDHYAVMTLKPGTKTETGAASLNAELNQRVTVPGKGNKFRINDTTVNVVRNAEGEPDQVLVLGCTSDVNEKKLAEKLKVWVLPKDKPKTATDDAISNYEWPATEVGPDVLKKSTRLKLEAIPTEHELSPIQSYKVDAKPGTRLFVRVEAGVEAFGGYVLLKPFEAVVVVPEYPRELRISHEGAVLSVSGDKKLTVAARGIPAFKVHLYRIQPKDLNHLITQSYGDFAHMTLRGSLTEENVSEIFTEVKELDASNPRIAQYAAVDFTPYLKEGGEQRGIYFVRVEAWNPKTNTAITRYSRSDEEAAPPPSEGEGEGEGYEAVENGGGEGEGEGGEGYPDGYEGDEGGGGSEGGGWGQLSDKRFVMLTDLGMIDKIDAQQNHWVFVMSFKNGGAVAGATIEVLAKNGSVVLKRTADANGAVLLPPLRDFTAEKTPVALVAKSDGDVSFLPFNRSDRNLDFSRFDVGGVRTNGKAAALDAFAFSDRGLYRPGETAHLSTLVRAVDWSRSMKGVPLELEVTDPRALVVKKQRVVLDAAGFTSLDFTPEESAPTGTYSFTVSVAEEKKSPVLLGSVTFRVEEFLPDRMRMTTRFDAPSPGWVTASDLKAIVELRNLFGTPAADHAVQASFSLSPYQPYFGKYPDHQFFDPARAKRSEDQRLQDTQTGEDGNVTFDLDLKSYAPATYQVSFYAEGFELGGGRSVSSVASIIVSPRKYMLGYKADGDLGFIKRGAPRAVEIIAVDPKLNLAKVDGLKAVLVEQRYVSVLTRESNGSYRYQSVLKDVTKKTDALTVAEKGTSLKLPSADVGSFYLVVRDAEDVDLLRVPFTIAGEANLAKDLERNAELKVSLDKPEYEPGETVTVQITAPYAGAGVITIERDKVYVHKTFKTTTSNTVQTIEVPKDLEVNGFINVSFVRSLDSPELYVSPLSYGVVAFKVLKKSQHLELSLKAEPLGRPGRPLAIKYKTDQPSKIVIFAIDEGILQVARYETPDPLGHFLARRALEVTTRQIVDLLLPEYRLVHGGGKEGGDDDAAMLARNLNPFKRKADKPAVFWSRIVDAGPDEKTVSFTVPESFNGTLRVMAVAASPEAMAAARTSAVIRGPFVVAPNTPTFASPGDTLTVTAAIANNVEGSGDKAAVKVKLEPNASFKLSGPAEQTLTIAEGREGVVSYQVTATDVLGDGELHFLVSGAKQEATRTATLSVRPASAYRVVTQAGSVKDNNVEVKVQRKMFDQLATREVTVSLLPLGLGAGIVDYLESYPHLCSEQLSSRAVPALVFMKRPEWGYDVAKAKTAFDRAFSILRSRQNEEGQFGYWAANSFVSDPLDVYIALMLTEAKERGAAAPNDVRLKAVKSLKARVDLPPTGLADARMKAMALYVLARNEVVMPAQTAQVADWLGRQGKAAEGDVAFAWLAGVYKLTNNAPAAQKVIESLVLSDKVTPDYTYYYDNHTYRAQVLYVMAKHFPARLDAVGPKLLGLLATSITEGLHSLSAGWSLYALDAYATAVAGTGQNGLTHVTLEAKEAGGEWKPQSLGSGLTLKAAFPRTAAAYRITAKDGPPIFYSLTEGGFDRDPPKEAVRQGVELIHTLEADDGKEVTKVALGDEINVRLRTRSLITNRSLSDMAITDLLPSGFELVLNRGTSAQGIERLVSSGATWRPVELDAREDRVVFYGTIGEQVGDLTYRIKAVSKGTFVVPPTQAIGMYDPKIVGRSTSGTITVE